MRFVDAPVSGPHSLKGLGAYESLGLGYLTETDRSLQLNMLNRRLPRATDNSIRTLLPSTVRLGHATPLLLASSTFTVTDGYPRVPCVTDRVPTIVMLAVIWRDFSALIGTTAYKEFTSFGRR